LSLVGIAILCGFVVNAEYLVPPPTFEADKYTVWAKERVIDKSSGAVSRKAQIHVPLDADDTDSVNVIRLDLVSDSAFARGYAHGFLLMKEILEFTGPKLDKFYMDEVLNLDISQFPDPLQKIFRVIQVAGALAAPRVFKEAMSWVWEKEQKYVPQYMIDEMEGIATGLCAKIDLITPSTNEAGVPTIACNVTEWSHTIKQLNMLPELIRMACTAYGAWGKATASTANPGGLLQLRALDFGSGPFANYSIIMVHRGSSKRSSLQPFVSVAFPAFVGAVTGISQSGIGISEKVWMTYNKKELLPGSYDGLADVFVLRDILQTSKNRAEAAKYLEAAARTWAIWIGIGDYETQQFDLVGYSQASSVVYTDVTAPTMTEQPYLENLAYVDKHPQPSHDGATGTLPTSLADFYGNITSETSKIIAQHHQTGDVHIATYDYSAKVMYVSVGKTNHAGDFGPVGGDDSVWKAYNRPYLKFNLPDLWAGN